MPILDNMAEMRHSVHFRSSALLAMVDSLHVIADPDHHRSCCDWARRVYRCLSDRLRGEVDFFAQNYAQWAFIMDVITELGDVQPGRDGSLDEALERMGDMPDKDFAYLFLGLSAFEYDKDMLDGWFAQPEALSVEDLREQAKFLSLDSVRYYLNSPGLVKQRLKRVFAAYWREIFQREWPSIDSCIRRVIENEQNRLACSDPFTYISGLHPDIKRTAERIIFQKDPDYGILLSQVRRIDIFPTVFGDPHLMANILGDKLVICLNLNFHAVMLGEGVPRDLYAILNASGDETRLKIIRILWNGSATTKELSEILGLTPGTVSLHLKVLKEAELVETQKSKKYVYYSLIRQPFYELSERFVRYLEY